MKKNKTLNPTQPINKINNLLKSNLTFINSTQNKNLIIKTEKNKNDKSMNTSRNIPKSIYFDGELSNDIFFNNKNNQKKTKNTNFDYLLELFNRSKNKSKSKTITPMNLSYFNSTKSINQNNNNIIHKSNNETLQNNFSKLNSSSMKIHNTINNLKTVINKTNSNCLSFHNTICNNNFYFNHLSISINNGSNNISNNNNLTSRTIKDKNKDYFNTFSETFRPKLSSSSLTVKKNNKNKNNIYNKNFSCNKKNKKLSLNNNFNFTQRNSSITFNTNNTTCENNNNNNCIRNSFTIISKRRNKSSKNKNKKGSSIIRKRDLSYKVKSIKKDIINSIFPKYNVLSLIDQKNKNFSNNILSTFSLFSKKISKKKYPSNKSISSKSKNNNNKKPKKNNKKNNEYYNKFNGIPKCHTCVQTKKNSYGNSPKKSGDMNINSNNKEKNKKTPEYMKKLDEIKMRTKKLCEVYINLINEQIEQNNNLKNYILEKK